MIKNNTFLFQLLYPIHLLTWVGVIVYHFHYGFSLINLVYFLIGWVLLEGIGVAVILHRYVSHKSFEIRPKLKNILLWISCLSLQGSPLGWAAIHRGSHHKYTDTEKDAHTPTKGWWYAWHGWLHDWDRYFNPKYVIDLLRDPVHLWFAKNYTLVILITYLVAGFVSLEFLLFGLMLPAVIGLYQESSINVLGHHNKFGYRNFETKDNSQNVPVLALTTWGQGWHNNHHYQASSYDFGTSVSGRWFEFDPCLLLLPLVATKESRRRIFKERNDKLHT